MRTRTSRVIRKRIQTSRVFTQTHLQIAVGAEEPPFRQNSPIGENLATVCSTAHLVRSDKGRNDIGRNRTALDKRQPWLGGSEMRVVVIEGCDVGREVAAHLYAITTLVGREVLCLKLMPTE